MILHTTNIDNITIIRIVGEVGIDNHEEFSTELERIVQGTQDIIIDMGELVYLNSMGLGTIVSLYSALKKQKRKFILCNINENIIKLFSVTKLDKVIEIVSSIDEAKESIKK